MSLSAEPSRVQADTPDDRLVRELLRRQSEPGEPVKVLLAELAKSMNVSERTIRRARRRLESRGLLSVIKGVRHEPNAYQVCT